MAKVKQKAARNGAAGASTRGAQAARQKRHRIAVQGDPNEKKPDTVVSTISESSWFNIIDNLPASIIHKLPPSVIKQLPTGVIYRGLAISEPDKNKVAFTEQPPPGYTFIAAGNPELTNAMKEFSTRGNHKIFVVTITPHAKRHELSRQIHRVGYHFPTTIVDQVCAHYGIRLSNKGELIDESKDEDLFRRVYQSAEGNRPVPAEEKDQVTINTDARQTIKDLFPKIPDSDLYRIIKHAFQLVDARVGTAPELTLIRRAHLAVVAHIRHNYTSYDKLLRRVQYNEARHQVEKETLEKIVEWRGGEDMSLEDTGHAANDLLKDVIVISDEEESEGEANDVQPLHQEQVRVEELPSAAHGRGYRRSASPIPERQHDQYQPYPRLVRTYRPSDAEIAQRNQTRYAVWNQIRQDYRTRIAQNPTSETIYEPEPAQPSRVLIPIDEPIHQHPPQFRTEAPAQRPVRIEYEPLPPHQPTGAKFFRDHNGDLYERVDHQPRTVHAETSQRYYQDEPTAMTGALVSTRPPSPIIRPERRYQGDYDSGDDTILPSIEGPDDSYLPPRRRRNPFGREEELLETNLARPSSRHHRDAALIDLTNSSSQTPKRRRLEEIAPPLPGPRIIRRESPVGLVERQYLPQQQVRSSQPEFRIVDHGEQRYSPRLQQASAVRANAYVDRLPLYDPREAPPAVTRVYEPLPASQQLLDAGRPEYRAQNFGPVRQNGIDSTQVLREPRYEPLPPAGRNYEPVVEHRAYDGRVGREQLVPVREQFAQPAMQEARVRYIYTDGTDAREPLQSLPPPRVTEYDRSGASYHSYAR